MYYRWLSTKYSVITYFKEKFECLHMHVLFVGLPAIAPHGSCSLENNKLDFNVNLYMFMIDTCELP